MWILRAMRSLTVSGTQPGARWVMSDSKRSSLATSQAAPSSRARSTRPSAPIADHLFQQAAGERADRLLHEPRQDRLLDDGLHVPVGDAVQGVHRHGGDLVDEPLGVALGEHPLGGLARAAPRRAPGRG